MDPERALMAFESLTGLRLTLYEKGSRFRSRISPRFYWHSGPLCIVAKSGPHGSLCQQWETQTLYRKMRDLPHGRVHCCHAGLVEWVVPVLDEGETLAILFAGQRAPGRDLKLDAVQKRGPVRLERKPKPVNKQQSAVYLEALQQLASRLLLWHRDAALTSETNTREHQIRHFIRRNFQQPLTIHDLAGHLNLSPDRTAHVVRELTGQSWKKLLTRARIRAATELLSHSDLTIAEIAQRSGFADQSAFHKAFRKMVQTTPARYRRDPETPSSPERHPR